MTIQVKLFSGEVSQNLPSHDKKYVEKMEKQMNEFLKTLDDEQVKKIYVAVGITRMGLIEYRYRKKVELGKHEYINYGHPDTIQCKKCGEYQVPWKDTKCPL